MRIVIDIETDALLSPSKVWVIVCKNLDTGAIDVFRNCTEEPSEAARFREYIRPVTLWVGHNFLEFDYPCLARLLGVAVPDIWSVSADTLILSRLFDYSDPHDVRKGSAASEALVRVSGRHSIESYGLEFGFDKLKVSDFSKYSKELETYCLRDVEICEKIYQKYQSKIEDPKWRRSILLEHQFQSVVNQLQDNGFAFNRPKAEKLLAKVSEELGELDARIKSAFPAKLRLVREVHPRTTAHGTLNKGDFRFVKDGDLSEFNGGPFSRCEWSEFNPSSHRQIIDVLTVANWSPTDKTQSHIDADRRPDGITLDKLNHLRKYGWKVNENNLSTLPKTAPAPARLLARRILLESRRRTLTEWLGLVQNGRIHGKFYGIGAWTHRMAHQKPNTANIPNEFDIQGQKKLLGKELRSLWCAPKNRLLVGVDAEGIQLRIFAHLINDPEFTDALVRGKKTDKTDPHSLNQRILGSVCSSRAAAKRFVYALLLGAGLWKLAQILECSEPECRSALDRLLERYRGWAEIREKVIPRDAKRGFFTGLDGRSVNIPGQTISERKHLAMSGYLQNGEAVCMKLATTIWMKEIEDVQSKEIFPYPSEASTSSRILESLRRTPTKDAIKIVNLVHDEWQTETPNNMAIALWVADLQSRALQRAGELLKLRCPLAGSYWNDDHKDYTIGTNWSVTH